MSSTPRAPPHHTILKRKKVIVISKPKPFTVYRVESDRARLLVPSEDLSEVDEWGRTLGDPCDLRKASEVATDQASSDITCNSANVMSVCLRHQAGAFGNEEAEYDIKQDVAKWDEMEVDLQVEHGVAVFPGSKPIGARLSISVEEAINWSSRTNESMDDSIKIWAVPELLSGRHSSPVLAAWEMATENCEENLHWEVDNEEGDSPSDGGGHREVKSWLFGNLGCVF